MVAHRRDDRPGGRAGVGDGRGAGGRHRHLAGRRDGRVRRLGRPVAGAAPPRRTGGGVARDGGARGRGQRRGRAVPGADDGVRTGLPGHARAGQPAARGRVGGGGPGRGGTRHGAPVIEGLRLAVTLLTVVPLGRARVDRGTARAAMLLAPAAGLLPGGAAALILLAGGPLGLPVLLTAVLAVAVTAAATRALHLDGLADLADGLGSGRPATDALAIMKRSDIGPFGVVTLLLTVLAQVAALAAAPHPAVAVLVASVAGRAVLPWACRSGVPSARPGGLGGLVAGTVGTRAALAVTAVVLAAAGGAGAATGGPGGAVQAAVAVLVALAAALVMLRHAVRRLGGVTGDVLGALVEIAVTAALVVLAARP
ncbi:adenosylcobinamide-GDP ribazoletransferase [Actinomadura geliboluensis]|uniref:Adenosylcobinamide-GDP ribazoletransferase n=1 Tax=Actinomadura geliboluensis TaxID=882440 RepID=A0A5S4GH36_9ACTN|nr:adenosylcobinamide-GDP ribazoletransferase [Actinomadura geliboluensis]